MSAIILSREVAMALVLSQLYGHNVESMKFINPQALSSALTSLMRYSPDLRVYKFHRLHIVSV